MNKTLRNLFLAIPLVAVAGCATQKGDPRLSSISGVPEVLPAQAVQACEEAAECTDAGTASNRFLSPLFLGSHWTQWDASGGDSISIQIDSDDDSKARRKGDQDEDEDDDEEGGEAHEPGLQVQNIDLDWLHTRVTHGGYSPEGSLRHRESILTFPFFFCYTGVKVEDMEEEKQARVDLGLLGALWLSVSEHGPEKNMNLSAMLFGSLWMQHIENGDGSTGPLWGFIGWRSRAGESGAPVFFWTALW